MYKDIIILICKNLDVKSISKFLQVNSVYYKYYDDEELWKFLWEKEFLELKTYNLYYGDNSTYYKSYKILYKYKKNILLNFPLLKNFESIIFKKSKNNPTIIPFFYQNSDSEIPIGLFYGDIVFNIKEKVFYHCVDHDEMNGPAFVALTCFEILDPKKKFNKYYYENLRKLYFAVYN